MMDEAPNRLQRQILLVGAYERDNFGDLLFLLLTERYFPTDRVTAAAPLGADMAGVFGRYIPPYGPLLKTQPFDIIWTVGGEIGSVSLGAAFNFSLGTAMLALYKDSTPPVRSAIRKSLSSDIDTDIAYMPTLQDFPLNKRSTQVLNSVGVSAVDRLKPAERERVLTKLSAASSISVRDRASSELLTENRIPHTMGPDMVHSIGVAYPHDDTASEPYFCFHGAASYIRSAAPERIAGHLSVIAKRTGLGVHLFVAGLAEGHDSLAAYADIRRSLQQIAPSVKVTISESRHPLDLVRTIRQSQGWIGTSLHGRVIAASYGLPRVSLSKTWTRRDLSEKTAVYAATWDPDMPYAVNLENLAGSFSDANEKRLVRRGSERGRELSWLAHKNMLRTIEDAHASVRKR